MIGQIRRLDRAVLVLLGVLLFCISFATAGRYGFAWDEPAYIESAWLHSAWWRGELRAEGSRFTEENLRLHWGEDFVRDAHAPLVKMLAAALLPDTLLRERSAPSTANLHVVRAIPAAFYALGAICIGAAGAKRFGRMAGLFALLAWAGLPRVFGHSHFVMLDLPVAVVCFAITDSMLNRLDLPTLSSMVTPGLLLGAGLLTKLNAFFAPVPVLLALLGAGRLRNAVIQAIVYPIGLLCLFLGWPRLWRDPIDGFLGYLGFHAHHFDVPVFYLGRIHNDGPWHYPFVMLAATLPAATLVLVLVACWVDRASLRTTRGCATALAGLVPLLLIASPFAPAYDGVRLFLPAMPWVALAAGRGAEIVVSRIGAHSRRLAVPAATALALALTIPAAWAFPWETDYYGSQVGGPRGARVLGFETTYLGHAVGPDTWAFLNRTAPWGANIWFTPFSPKVVLHTRLLGLLRRDLRCESSEPPDLVVLLSRRAEYGPLERAFDDLPSLFEVAYEGVPLVRVIAPMVEPAR